MFKRLVFFVLFVVGATGCAGAPEELMPIGAVPTVELAGEVNLNLATAAQLSQLPRFDADLAQAVVADREKNGPFFTREELMRVTEVTESVYAAVRMRIKVGYCAGHDACGNGQVCYFLDASRPTHMGVCQPGDTCRYVQCGAGTVCTMDRSEAQVRPVCRAIQ